MISATCKPFPLPFPLCLNGTGRHDPLPSPPRPGSSTLNPDKADQHGPLPTHSPSRQTEDILGVPSFALHTPFLERTAHRNRIWASPSIQEYGFLITQTHGLSPPNRDTDSPKHTGTLVPSSLPHGDIVFPYHTRTLVPTTTQ